MDESRARHHPNLGGFQAYISEADKWPKPLTGRWIRCDGCGQRFVEPRQLHNVRELDGVLWGDCPVCHTPNDLTGIKPSDPETSGLTPGG